MEGTDVCFAPVVDFEEATNHPHIQSRPTFTEVVGVMQSAPAPRFSKTFPEIQSPSPETREHTETALMDWGVSEEKVEPLPHLDVI